MISKIMIIQEINVCSSHFAFSPICIYRGRHGPQGCLATSDQGGRSREKVSRPRTQPHFLGRSREKVSRLRTQPHFLGRCRVKVSRPRTQAPFPWSLPSKLPRRRPGPKKL